MPTTPTPLSAESKPDRPAHVPPHPRGIDFDTAYEALATSYLKHRQATSSPPLRQQRKKL